MGEIFSERKGTSEEKGLHLNQEKRQFIRKAEKHRDFLEIIGV